VSVPSGRTIGALGGLTVVAFLLALGTFDVYIAVLEQVLLVAGVLAIVGASRARRHQHCPGCVDMPVTVNPFDGHRLRASHQHVRTPARPFRWSRVATSGSRTNRLDQQLRPSLSRAMSSRSTVNGHSVLPAHGHENSPLVAMRIPQWRPSGSPSVINSVASPPSRPWPAGAARSRRPSHIDGRGAGAGRPWPWPGSWA